MVTKELLLKSQKYRFWKISRIYITRKFLGSQHEIVKWTV